MQTHKILKLVKLKSPVFFSNSAGMFDTTAKAVACLLFSTSFGWADAACNPQIAALLRTAWQNGDANTTLTLPNLSLLDLSDTESRGWGRKISLLLKRRISLNVLLAELNQHRDESKPVVSVDGLTSFQGTDITGFMKMQTYFASDKDVVTDVMMCNILGSAPSPSCQHWIANGGFSLQANYGRDWLPKWLDIRTTLLAAFARCDVQ